MAAVRPGRCVLLLAGGLALGSLSCGGESEPTGGTDPCEVPNRLLADGRCLAPAVQDNGCPAGQLGLADGSCQQAGLPPDLCTEGGEPLGDVCYPILPPESCPPGQMAVPGEAACREVAPCGQGPWGDIPVGGDTQFVDGAYAGGDSDGTAERPWTTVGEAIAAAAPAAVVAIAAGSYAEDIIIAGKAVTLWGVCPAAVELVGSATAQATVFIRTGADGTAVRDLAIRGETTGLTLSGSENVVLDRLWVHDTAGRGINVEQTLGPATFTVAGTLLEHNQELGLYAAGSAGTIESSVLRHGQPMAANQTGGRAISVEVHPHTLERGNVAIRAILLEDNRDVGLYVSGSDVTLDSSVLRRTLPQVADQTNGRAISAQYAADTSERANLRLHASLIEQNHETGVFLQGSDAVIEGTVVRGTQSQVSDQTSGRGIGIQRAPDVVERASLTLLGAVVEENHDLGVYVSGSDALIEGTIVRNNLPRPTDQAFGRGIGVQRSMSLGERATATIRASLIEQNHENGVFVSGSDAAIESTVVQDTAARAMDGLFGDGVVVMGFMSPASCLLSSSRVSSNVRVGVAVFGAHLGVAASALECNLIDLNTESLEGVAPTLDDQGQNHCGCGSEPTECKAASQGLEPPVPVPAGP